MTEKDIKELQSFLQTYEGNKDDFINGVFWAASREHNPIVCMALEAYLRNEEEALNNLEE